MPRRSGVRLRTAYWPTLPDFGVFDPFDPANVERRSRFAPEVEEEFILAGARPGAPGPIDPCRVDTDGVSRSALVTWVRNPGAAADALPATGSMALTNGSDDPVAIDDGDFAGELAGLRTELQGLAALETAPHREVALVYAPAASASVGRRLVGHCEKLRDRFAVLDCDSGTADPRALDPRATIQDTRYAAFYAPWVEVLDPQTGARRLVPPGGHVLGVYARTDAARGVFMAPANETLRGVQGLQVELTDDDQSLLNPRGVNVIRRLAERGIRVWGARTLSSDPRWKYVNVRRLLIFLERSIDQGTQWVVFGPNAVPLWTQVKDSIERFLHAQWREGALSGSKPEEAFVVRCDETTMTRDDRAAGRLVCDIGVAPLRPAEFVVFRMVQFTAEAQG
jgi:phage tail sheath protein FI